MQSEQGSSSRSSYVHASTLKATWHQICCSVSNVDLWQFRCITDWGCNRSLSLVTGDQRDVQDGSLHVADPRLLTEVKHDLHLEWKKTQQGGLTFHLPCTQSTQLNSFSADVFLKHYTTAGNSVWWNNGMVCEQSWSTKITSLMEGYNLESLSFLTGRERCLYLPSRTKVPLTSSILP